MSRRLAPGRDRQEITIIERAFGDVGAEEAPGGMPCRGTTEISSSMNQCRTLRLCNLCNEEGGIMPGLKAVTSGAEKTVA